MFTPKMSQVRILYFPPYFQSLSFVVVVLWRFVELA